MHPERERRYQPDLGKEGKSTWGSAPSSRCSIPVLAAALKHVTSMCFQNQVLLSFKCAGPRLTAVFLLAVARTVPGGAGQVLRTGSEGTAAPHAALPRLVCQRQLCEWLRRHGPPPHGMARNDPGGLTTGVCQTSHLVILFLMAR